MRFSDLDKNKNNFLSDQGDLEDFWVASRKSRSSKSKESKEMSRETYYRDYAKELKEERKKEERLRRKKILEEKRNSETFLLDLFKEVDVKDKSKEEIEQINHHDEMTIHVNKIRDYYVPRAKAYLEEMQNTLGSSVKVLLCEQCCGSRIKIKRNKQNLICSVEQCTNCSKGIQIVPADVYEREHKEKMALNLKENLDKLEKSDKVKSDKELRDKVNEAFSPKDTNKNE